MYILSRALTLYTYRFEDRYDCTPSSNYNECYDTYDQSYSSSTDCYKPSQYYHMKYNNYNKSVCDNENVSNVVAFLSSSLNNVVKKLQSDLNRLFANITVNVTEGAEVNASELQELVDEAISKNCSNQSAEVKILTDKLIEEIISTIDMCIDEILGHVGPAFATLNAAITAEITALAALTEAEIAAAVQDLAGGLLPTLLGFTTTAQNALTTATTTEGESCEETLTNVLNTFTANLTLILNANCGAIASDINGILEQNLETVETTTTTNIEAVRSQLSNTLRTFESTITNSVNDWVSTYLNKICNKKKTNYKNKIC